MKIPLTKYRRLVVVLALAGVALSLLVLRSPILLVWQVRHLGGGVEIESGSPDWIARQLPEDWFLPWDTVVGFELTDTSVSFEALQSLVELPGLEIISLCRVSIVNADRKPPLWQGAGIRYLGLREMPVGEELLVGLSDLPSLTYLFFVDIELSDSEMKHVAKCSELTVIGFTGSLITDAGLREIRGMPKIHLLNLEGTEIGSAAMAWVPRSVRFLDLRGTRVDDGSLTALQALPDLKVLDIRGTRISAAGAADMIARMPACRIDCDKVSD